MDSSLATSSEDWVELMAEYEAGDLSQREFCGNHDVAYSAPGEIRSPDRSVRSTRTIVSY